MGARVRGAAPWRGIGLGFGALFAGLATCLVLFLAFADWNALRGPIARWASAMSGREIAIRGDLDVRPWSLTPAVRVGGLSIGNPARYQNRGAFAEVEDAEVELRLLPLLWGRFDIVRLELTGADISLYRSAEGVSNWSSAQSGRPFNWPAVRSFSMRDGRVRLNDEKRRLTLDAEFSTEESAGQGGRFVLSGEGRINRRPFSLELSGPPLLNVRRDRPYAFVGEVRAGATRIRAEGAVRRPFDLAAWAADIEASGADLAQLYELTGLALPNTPPYRLAGRIERAGGAYAMPHVAGRIGDSDIRGAFRATRRANDRLFLDGDFQSASLDFDDLLTVLGAPPSTAGDETASAEQRRTAEEMRAAQRVLPDARLDMARVRTMDARVSFRAARVRSERFPLRGFAADIALEDGLLRLDPLSLDLRQGRLGGAVALDAREDAPRAAIDVRLTNARVESILALSEQAPISGALVGRARLSGVGASVREAAANAHGEVMLAMPSGEVREALAELTGINVTRGLGLLIANPDETINVRCAMASFRVQRGVARAQTILIDTETVLIGGEGEISLRDETLDLRLQGEPKTPRLVRVSAPIRIGGRLRDPSIGVDAGDALGQGGIAALLASLVAPLAAVLPFLDPGLADNADCAALLAGRPQPQEG